MNGALGEEEGLERDVMECRYGELAQTCPYLRNEAVKANRSAGTIRLDKAIGDRRRRRLSRAGSTFRGVYAQNEPRD